MKVVGVVVGVVGNTVLAKEVVGNGSTDLVMNAYLVPVVVVVVVVVVGGR